MRDLIRRAAGWLLIVLLAWVGIADTVFRFRHPWTSSAERLVWIASAMRFESVPYPVMRPREVP